MSFHSRKFNRKFEQIDEDPYLSPWSDDSEETGDEELENWDSLQKLRLISDRTIKNSSVARAIQQAKKASIIGGTMFVQVDAPESTKEQIENLLAEQYKAIDINHEYSLQEMLEQVIIGAFDKGDILINLPTDESRGKIATYMELVEASRILTPYEFTRDPLVRNGVQYTLKGKITGYWVKKINTKIKKSGSLTLFSDKKENFDFFPTFKGGRRVCYLFKAPTALRPNMSRQYPVLTSCMNDIRLLEKYIKAVVIGAQVSACYSGFITTSNAAGAKVASEASAKGRNSKINIGDAGKIQPGTMTWLRRGDSVDFASPSKPADNTEPFIKRMLINSCASARVAYEIAFMHLEDVTLSSWKGGTIEASRDAKLWQNDLAWVTDWVSKTIILEAITERIIKGSLKNVEITPHFPDYDPNDEEKAARGSNINLNKNFTTSRHIVCGKNNIDYDKMLEDRTNEALDEVTLESKILIEKKKLEEKHGIIFGSVSPEQAEVGLASEEAKASEPDNAGKRDTSGSRRPGEDTGADLDPEDARDRERDDGNI